MPSGGFNLRRLGDENEFDFTKVIKRIPNIDKNKYMAVYIRQSKKGADDKHGESRETQLKLKRLAALVVGEARVKVYDEGAGKSGQLRIDEREELNRLYLDCEAGIIGGIIIAREDRLFRDKHGVQSGTFTSMAEEKGIIVIVPPFGKNQVLAVYNFSNLDDLRAFQEKMRIAYDYIPGHIGYMLHGNRNKAKRGCYDGRNLPPGLAILLSAEKENQKPVLYRPWADIMVKVFLRLKELDWDVHKYSREVEAMAYLFPDISGEDQKTYLIKHSLRKVPGGYKPRQWETIADWMVNIHLLGWWLVDRQSNDVIVDNHAAVLDRALFEEGYMARTGYTLEGEPVPHKLKKTTAHVRKGQPEVTALVHGKITTPGARVSIARQNNKPHVHYYYKAMKREEGKLRKKCIFSIPVEDLDDIIVNRLRNLSKPENDVNMADRVRKRLKEMKDKQKGDTISIVAQLKTIDANIKKLRGRLLTLKEVLDLENVDDDGNIITSLESTEEETDDEAIKTIKAMGNKLKELAFDKKVLLAKQKQLETIDGEQIEEFYDVLGNFEEKWPALTLERKQKMVRAMAKKIEIAMLSPHWCKLVIHWSEAILTRPDICILWRQTPSLAGDMEAWELEIIKQYYPSCNHPLDLLQLIPTRSWYCVRNFATHKLKIKREVRRSEGFLQNVCWNDLQIFNNAERALKMAQEATAACTKANRAKKEIGKHLYAFWLLPANLKEVGETYDLEGLACA